MCVYVCMCECVCVCMCVSECVCVWVGVSVCVCMYCMLYINSGTFSFLRIRRKKMLTDLLRNLASLHNVCMSICVHLCL